MEFTFRIADELKQREYRGAYTQTANSGLNGIAIFALGAEVSTTLATVETTLYIDFTPLKGTFGTLMDPPRATQPDELHHKMARKLHTKTPPRKKQGKSIGKSLENLAVDAIEAVGPALISSGVSLLGSLF
jgi:hypothetical protein